MRYGFPRPRYAVTCSLIALFTFAGSGGVLQAAPKRDSRAPTVSIVSPASGITYTVAQTVNITASASDNVGVSKVEFYDNGVLKCTDTAATYTCAWSFTSTNNGSHSWTAKAYDAAGNVATSSAVSLSVNISAADTTRPTVSITSPASGTTYTSAQTVTITASASDNIGVSKVEFYDNGVLKCTDTAAAYACAWSFTSANNGSHSWTAKAYDAAGNVTTSSAVSLSVNVSAADATPPNVSITSPASGTTYTTTQTVTISASASDNAGVTKVEFYDGSVLKGTDTASPYSYAWAISSAVNGSHSWAAKAYDAAGNTAIAAVNLSVNIATSDTTAPSVSITSPASGTTYTTAKTVTIAASASDNIAVTKVEFYDGSVLKGSDTTSPYSYAWSFTSANNGTHSWTARAYDGAGNVKASSAVGVTVNVVAGGAHLWSLQFGGPTTADVAAGRATAIDPFGEVFVAAVVSGTVDFGDGSKSSSGGAVLAKYSADGAIRWSRLWTRSVSAELTPTATVANTDGSVVVAGYFFGTVDIGGVPLTSAGGYDVFLVKYASDGRLLWAHRVGAGGSEVPNAAAVAADGSLLLAGYLQGSASLGGIAFATVGGSRDVFLAKYSSNGTHVWSKSFGGSSTDVALGVGVDGVGNPWITGSFQGSVDFGDGSLVSAGSTDAFVAGFYADGRIFNSWREGATGRDEGRGIGVDGAGNVVVAQSFEGSVSFGGQALTSRGYVDFALLQYAPTGAVRWTRQAGGSNNDMLNDLAVNSAGEIAVTGTFISWIDLGGTSLYGNGSIDVFIAKYAADGSLLWSKPGGVEYDDYGAAVALEYGGEVLATGHFYRSVDFGGNPMTTELGSTDGYLVRFAP